MKTVAEITKNMAQAIGTERYIKSNFWKDLVFTDGVDQLRQDAEAFWLVDAIASHRIKDEFQAWILTVNLITKVGNLVCTDGNGNELARQNFSYTNFPLPKITFFVELGGYGSEDNWTECLVLMLPSER